MGGLARAADPPTGAPTLSDAGGWVLTGFPHHCEGSNDWCRGGPTHGPNAVECPGHLARLRSDLNNRLTRSEFLGPASPTGTFAARRSRE